MMEAELAYFIKCYNPENRHKSIEIWSENNPDDHSLKFSIKEILERDKASLDIFWIKDKSLANFGIGTAGAS